MRVRASVPGGRWQDVGQDRWSHRDSNEVRGLVGSDLGERLGREGALPDSTASCVPPVYPNRGPKHQHQVGTHHRPSKCRHGVLFCSQGWRRS